MTVLDYYPALLTNSVFNVSSSCENKDEKVPAKGREYQWFSKILTAATTETLDLCALLVIQRQQCAMPDIIVRKCY